MKILFDARWILLENRFDGVSRYSYELAHALAARDDTEMVWLVHDKRQLEKLPPGEHVLANNPEDFFAETFTLARRINNAGYTLVYSPFFLMGTLGKRYKLILTIHDMIYFTHRTPPQWLAWHIRLGWRLFHLTYWPMRWQLNKADVVATVSETACKELLAARATKRQVVTVANAVSDSFRIAQAGDSTRGSTQNSSTKGEGILGADVLAGPASSDLRANSEGIRDDGSGESATTKVVYMGAFTPYKNVECVIDAVALVPDVTLHLCGKLPPSRRPEIERRLQERGIAERTVLYDGATDEQYLEALAGARCSISASRLEGFGLPLIEAQKAGTPFVASDTPIFREIGEGSVLYFNPDSPEQAAECIRALANEKTHKDYVARGYQNAARYTWERSAEVAAEICKKLI